MPKRRRIALWLAGGLIVALVLAVATGPRARVDGTVRFDVAAIGDDPVAYLRGREAETPGIRDGLGKDIIWADPDSPARTPLAIVYVHGFSASRGELQPVPQEIAAAQDANLFVTRLTGHGLDGAALGQARADDWIEDYAEAMEIGRRIGERVVVIAVSTGAALASWGATQPALSEDVAGMILVSPNYAVRAGGAFLLTWPWGGRIADLVVGPERGFTPRNDLHARYWTTRYPTRALLPMAATARLARNAAVEQAGVPALFIYSPADGVVDARVTATMAERWGAAHEQLIVDQSGDPQNHVIAGDAISPQTNSLVIGVALDWIARTIR